jgi:AraC-like DNA-binding protein
MAMSLRPQSASGTELVGVSLSAARLRQLLGAKELPAPFRELMESDRVREVKSQALTPRVLRLFDEIVGEHVTGPSRALWHEAKALELVALLTDELAEGVEAERPILSAGEIERVERVRRHLVAHLHSPPTLAELARQAAMSETKLKGAFRVVFRTSLFACLRQARMAEAHRLLGERRLSVTEIAQRVGYANPSKFAAAFRRQFGRSPSGV